MVVIYLSEYLIRIYNQADLEGVIDLYRRSNGLFFKRDKIYIKYFLSHPDISPDGILILDDKGVIKGISFIGINNVENVFNGSILELMGYNELCSNILLKESIDYCIRKNVDIIYYDFISNYRDVSLSNWIKLNKGVMMLKPLTVKPLLEKVINEPFVKNKIKNKTILFMFESETLSINFSTSGDIELTNADRQLHSKLVIKLDSKIFLEILLGRLNPLVAYLNGDVHINGLKNSVTMLKILSYLYGTVSIKISNIDIV